MNLNSILANCEAVCYHFDEKTRHFIRNDFEAAESSLNRLPDKLQFARTTATHVRRNAKFVIHSLGRQQDGSYFFFTGLKPLGLKNWFVGNDYQYMNGKKVVSLCLFHFSGNNMRLSVYRFNGFDMKTATLRKKFSKIIISQSLQFDSVCF